MINISNLSSRKSGKSHIFTDLNLDLLEKQVSGNNRSNDVAVGNDIVVDHDLAAIKNAIYNILFQKRYLSDLNVNLRRYIGEVASQINGENLGEEIRRGISVHEPRVKVEKILVFVDIDNNLYEFTLFLKIFNFNNAVRLDASLDQAGNFNFRN